MGTTWKSSLPAKHFLTCYIKTSYAKSFAGEYIPGGSRKASWAFWHRYCMNLCSCLKDQDETTSISARANRVVRKS